MSKSMSFSGRVAVVTGAGGGLGRQYALDLARRGCKVVVNDLGGTFDGSGHSSRAADKVVEEITVAGGEAIPNYNSVTDGEAIIKSAVDKWGRIDILINNAGILRDRSLAKMTDDDWKLVVDVHLNGVYKCSRAAWTHMLKQGYGRIVNVSSASGLYGNYGQVNYSMAKSGILGMTKTMAIEGKKRGILCNVIVPVAASRMTETIMPPDLLAQLSPEFVSPLVVAMCHESYKGSGEVFEAGAGWFSKVRIQRSRGLTLKWPYQPEDLLDEKVQNTIADFSQDAAYPSSSGEALMSLMQTRGDAVAPPSAVQPQASSSTLKSARIFDIIRAYFDHPSKPGSPLVKKLNTTYTFEIYEGKKVGVGKSRKWTLNLKDAPGKCYETKEADGACTISLIDDNFMALVKDELQPQAAFMQGKLKLKGDLAAAMKFTPDVLPKFDPSLADNTSLSAAEVVELFFKTSKM
ncbi:estradiol 17 beta-dehydrogenase, putative [Perkinsus marinus ATCC 50983]|uniref:Estradiol 17 beta-dehydrogenase, putative n=1 Tax=Perkinsus marinus (strain ATCC 50983 / TXsc) TaxID=423536 RepID=C5KUW5_PERM5|nr:estradiol 17 beta-dehydrogenase, putative [Perkinsus marinus ATCC 50983]EER11680.1 estradiol 17 beta-dehydrogenase, putative [Perkinsus marinus ATCC 50983]|eukprot:XP_002779885.1 estradiol 17 beta-dehydrogenase, putative [Perkinsus marinus ATCC 50983]